MPSIKFICQLRSYWMIKPMFCWGILPERYISLTSDNPERNSTISPSRYLFIDKSIILTQFFMSSLFRVIQICSCLRPERITLLTYSIEETCLPLSNVTSFREIRTKDTDFLSKELLSLYQERMGGYTLMTY